MADSVSAREAAMVQRKCVQSVESASVFVPVARLLEWAEITNERVSIRTFPGEHEFLFNRKDSVSSRLESDLQRGALLRQPHYEEH
jgi:surfactin synthase thioesterase subunit